LNPRPLGGPEHDLFNRTWTSIRVDPKHHIESCKF
jgi:hypothetical protein